MKETLGSGEKLEFEKAAMDLFQIQYKHNPVYRQWCDYVKGTPDRVNSLEDIPFLPIGFFKQKQLSIFKAEPELFFRSSGTGGYGQSKHAAYDPDFYDLRTQRIFEATYGPIQELCVLALLPAYLEREGSSLVRMAQHFINLSGDPDSGFYLHNLEALADKLKAKQAAGKKILLLGVSFALWDLAEQFPQNLSGQIIMETGGMKGRRKELIRADLHQIFKGAFQVDAIHSEYGMTELFSQAYSRGDGLFYPPDSMRVYSREMEDPFSRASFGKTGGLNIIDLANMDTCAFIETQDLGRCYEDASFEVLGRFDRAEVRGCNLMIG
ncbi:acyl transferase [Croceimicrobium sp.]|uniref:LuxE/PaaK family acyltransferase n=1 Tax=Croceimicrobium sp. TaxID=2828340 RepID=UPI003BABF7C9